MWELKGVRLDLR